MLCAGTDDGASSPWAFDKMARHDAAGSSQGEEGENVLIHWETCSEYAERLSSAAARERHVAAGYMFS